MGTRIWTGAAADIKQVDTVTVANTWATNDTITVTMNGKAWVFTVKEPSPTAASVAGYVKKLWNNESVNATTQASANFVAQNFGEFAEIEASVSGAVVTMTGKTAGKPFTITSVTESTAGDGTATLAAEVVAATGKHHWSDADNWSGDTVPTHNDNVIFDRGNISCLYDINTAIDPATVRIMQAYTGQIGLPKVNRDDSSKPYDEYREDYLTFTDNASNFATLTIGEGEGQGSPRIKIDLNDTQITDVYIEDSAVSADPYVPTILIKGGSSSCDLHLRKGKVGYAFYDGEVTNAGNIYISYASNALTDASLICGPYLVINAAKEISMLGGYLRMRSTSATAWTTVEVHAGTVDWEDAAITTLTMKGGTLYDAGTDTFATVNIHDKATIDCTRSQEAQTWTTTNVYGSGKLVDTARRITHTNNVDCIATTAANINKGEHYTVAYTDI